MIPDALLVFANIPQTGFVVKSVSAYAQDTWRVGRGLHLTYGMRWEVNADPHVSAGQAFIISGFTDPADRSSALFVPSGKGFYATSWSAFAPRLGIAWQIHDGRASKTVLRVGSGRFFDLGQGGFEGQAYNEATSVSYTNQPLGSITGGSASAPDTEPRNIGV